MRPFQGDSLFQEHEVTQVQIKWTWWMYHHCSLFLGVKNHFSLSAVLKGVLSW